MADYRVLSKLVRLRELVEQAGKENSYLLSRDTKYRRTRLRKALLEIRKLADGLREDLLE